MKTATRIFPAQQFFLYIAALMMVIASFFAASVPRAHAAALTPLQIQAVTGLLKSFDVDSETIGAVEAQLNGSYTSTSGENSGSSGATAVSSAATNSGEIHARPPKPTSASTESKKPEIRTSFPGVSACGFLMRNLGKGDTGDDVLQLQGFLQNTGDFTHGSTTGYFGEITEKALKQWQAREGIVASGEAASTGFGAFGPKTRQQLMMRCKDNLDAVGSHTSSTRPDSWNTYASSTPVCVLKANKTSITPGESVALKWESKYATWASTIGGDKGLPNGSITLTPSDSTTYIKRVYSATGEGQCTVTVYINESTSTPIEKVVLAPKSSLLHVLSTLGSGMAAVFEAYVGLFDI